MSDSYLPAKPVTAGRAAAQVAAVPSVVAVTLGAADGSFIVSMNVNATTATTYSFTCECAYTDEANVARVLTLTFTVVAGTQKTTLANTDATFVYMGVPQHIRCKAATSITLRTQAAGTYTTVTFNVDGVIQQLA